MTTEISISEGTLDGGTYLHAMKFFMLVETSGRKKRWGAQKRIMHLEDTDDTRSAIVEVVGDETLVVSVLRTNSSDINSFVEVRINLTNPLYNEIKEAIAALNIINVGEEIEGVGYCAGKNLFQIQISKDLHAKILNQ